MRLGEMGISSMLVWLFEDNTRDRLFYQALGGEYLREREITLVSGTMTLVAYGWQDIMDLAAMAGHRGEP